MKVYIDGNKYDITDFKHPGGSEILKNLENEDDISQLFHSYHFGSNFNYMKRRTVLRNISLGFGSLVSLPTWAARWNQDLFDKSDSFNHEKLLAALVETFIPTTDTLGAKDLGVHQFVQKMITDCYDKQAQTDFEQILSTINPLSIKAFGKPFAEGDANQRIELLQSLAQSQEKNIQKFYHVLRGLTIQGYTQSEYYMTRFTDYEMAPARFHGCVPIKK